MDESRNKVILVNLLPSADTSYEDRGAAYPATAVLLLAAVLKGTGVAVTILDGAYQSDYLDALSDMVRNEKDSLLFVGLSVMTPQVALALAVSRRIKEVCEHVPVVWGGAHPTLFPEQTVRHPDIDLVAINEATETVAELVAALRSGGDLRNVSGLGLIAEDGSFVRTGTANPDDLATLPHLDLTMIQVENYLAPPNSRSVYTREFPRFDGPIRAVPILTGLGCPYKCQFCINVILRRRYRCRPAPEIVAEIRRLMDAYRCNTFIFMDENFFVNKKRVLEFVKLVEEEGLHFNWRMWCRVDHFHEDYINAALLRRMERIGHGSLVMGGESGSPGILEKLQKGTTVEQILHSLRLLKSTGITPRYSFMVGLEDETLSQIRDTYRLCLRMTAMHPAVSIAGPFPFRLYPGSPMYERLAEKVQLRVPEKLDDWEDLFLCHRSVARQNVWAPEAFRLDFPVIDFYASRALSPPVRPDCLHHIVRRIIRAAARFRLRHFWWRFPLYYRWWKHRSAG